jgi:hypothetical protein
MKIKLLFIFILSLFASYAFSAERHVGSGQTYSSINSAISASSAGDIIIIHDGTYAEGISTIPNGTSWSSGGYTIIKALNDGSVNITGGLTMAANAKYIQFEGLKWSGTNSKEAHGNNIKFFRCAFNGGPYSGNSAAMGLGNTSATTDSYMLFEDCWFYGIGGRYNLLTYRANHVIFRRCVIRHDGGWGPNGGNPEAGISIYNSQYVLLQNCIVINSDLTSSNNPGSLSGYSYWGQAFYIIYNSSCGDAPDCLSTTHISVDGCMAIHNVECGFRFDGSPTTITLDSFTSNVAIGTNQTGEVGAFGNGGQGTVTVTGGPLNGGYSDYPYGVVSVNGTDNTFFKNITNQYYSATGGTHNNTNPGTAWLYIPKHESGSAGPTILKRIGTSGTLYGDTGYNTTTADNLWPWPNEARIKTDMASVSTRGFCAAGKQKNGVDTITLTSYIWEYLGTQMPSDIYAGTTSPPPVEQLPGAPGSLSINQ